MCYPLALAVECDPFLSKFQCIFSLRMSWLQDFPAIKAGSFLVRLQLEIKITRSIFTKKVPVAIAQRMKQSRQLPTMHVRIGFLM
jgi:hypothetical protein